MAQVIGALYLVTVLSSTAYAPETSESPFSARVTVTVVGSKNIIASVSSYLTRELRSLNDVELVDNNAAWQIKVVALELENVGGYKTGVALATLIIAPYGNQILSGLFLPKCKDDGLAMTSGLAYYPDDHVLKAGSTDHLQSLCKDIVTDFDKMYLEEDRRHLRQIKKYLQKSK